MFLGPNFDRIPNWSNKEEIHHNILFGIQTDTNPIC
jgi:hypothetical protein